MYSRQSRNITNYKIYRLQITKVWLHENINHLKLESLQHRE